MGVQQILERVPAFAGVEPQVLEKMASYAIPRSYRRGDYIWQAGDQARVFTVIRNGLVKLVRPGPRGRSAISGLFGPPETVGDVSVLKGIAYPSGAVVATEQAHVITIPREVVIEGTRKSPRLGVSLACSLHNKLSALHVKIEVLSAGSVEARLATLLLKLYDQFGDDFEDGTSTIPVALSRRELSDSGLHLVRDRHPRDDALGAREGRRHRPAGIHGPRPGSTPRGRREPGVGGVAGKLASPRRC